MPTSLLLVDDEPNILTILEEALTSAGFDVTACKSGDEALPHLEENPPDLVLTDLKMPGVSGMELARRARNIAPDAPVVILTGYGDMKSAVEALRLGAFDYLTKPVDIERLLRTLHNAAERRRLILENRSLLQSLEEVNRLKTEFINGLSHEVRTPLGHILGFVQILQDTLEGLAEKQVRYLEHIHSAAGSLLDMFENMLQYSTLKSGDNRIVLAPFSLAEFIGECVQPYLEPAGARPLTLEHRADSRSVSADVEVCRKALSLLLDNAVKFCKQGGRIDVVASIHPTPALPDGQGPDLQAPGVKEWLHIAVTDTGPGIAPEDQERIFNLFEQADGGLDRQHEGTGLGLALAQSLARAHGGDIALRSAPGKGSTFTLVIPLATP